MHILFLTSQLPEPPHAGGTLRTNGLLRGVSAAEHVVHVLSFGTPEQLEANRDALDSYCASVDAVPPPARRLTHRLYDLLFTRRADMQRRTYSPLYRDRLKQVLQRQPFDLIQIESLEMAAYLPTIQHVQPGTPVIYDSFNAEFALQRSVYKAERRSLRRVVGALYSRAQWRRLVRFERHVCESVTHTIAVSDTDAALFNELVPGCPVSVVPNGIDVSPYTQSDTSLDLGDHALVFTGSMGYRPNVDAALWFADQVLDRVRDCVPDATFFVVGNDPHPRLNPLREREGIQITGWVPDINPFLHAAAVYVVPLRMGSGTRLKVLQAMAAGQAITSTTMGIQGVDVQAGREVEVADTAPAFAQAVIALLEDSERRAALGAAAARFVQAHYDWSIIVPHLLAVYDRIQHDRQAASQAK
jgi:glycosyltransferase involved in cell wall biosynthesis